VVCERGRHGGGVAVEDGRAGEVVCGVGDEDGRVEAIELVYVERGEGVVEGGVEGGGGGEEEGATHYLLGH